MQKPEKDRPYIRQFQRAIPTNYRRISMSSQDAKSAMESATGSAVGSGGSNVDPAKQNRLPRYRRAQREGSLILTQRDLDILRIIESLRVATSEHIQALAAGSDQGKLRRLQKLYPAGYVDRITPRRVYGAG